jgi:hypothetical protein
LRGLSERRVVNLALLNCFGDAGAATKGAAGSAGLDHFGIGAGAPPGTVRRRKIATITAIQAKPLEFLGARDVFCAGIWSTRRACRSRTWRRPERVIGGSFYFDLGDEKKCNFERKFMDLDGILFDISNH